MTIDQIFEIIKTGGPAAMALLCFWLYLRESKKRDDAWNKLEQLTERCLKTLNDVDSAMDINAKGMETVHTTINVIIAFMAAEARNNTRLPPTAGGK